jgi:putative hydrolase of the HAD superfamily
MLGAVLFDLDDTLYRELDFVESALDAVALEAAEVLDLPAATLGRAFRDVLAERGRGRTVDEALLRCGVSPERTAALVPSLVATYRAHRPPALALHDDAARCLEVLRERGIALGLVTDGDPRVQRAKVAALGLERWLGVLRFTWDAGAERQKPHADAYRPALDWLAARGIAPAEVAYVGDNPAKDFAGARALGLATVRLLRGPHAGIVASREDDADVSLTTLEQLVPWIDRRRSPPVPPSRARG